MRKEPSGSLTRARAAGPWQTAETTLLNSLNSRMIWWEVESVARSNMAILGIRECLLVNLVAKLTSVTTNEENGVKVFGFADKARELLSVLP